MPAAFSTELSGRRVLDRRGDLIGKIVDLVVDEATGNILGMLLNLDTGLDSNLLPWPKHGDYLLIPTEEIESVDEDIHIAR
ncbi:MAG: PRC-barrel domain-containing protein [Candidatus Thalassarchaeaceae archaeon]|jgi:sporulation protein YlmC with PRC-barrel domain|nr:PRC-barrel domain-containing protein [Candidatus Thalassarchaeaceae archaeon]